MTVATSNLGDCNSPGESLSCSFIFDILMTTTAQDCEKGRGSPSSCRPRGDAGTRHPGALRSQEPLPADFFPCSGPTLEQPKPLPHPPIYPLSPGKRKIHVYSLPTPSSISGSGGCGDKPSSPRPRAHGRWKRCSLSAEPHSLQPQMVFRGWGCTPHHPRAAACTLPGAGTRGQEGTAEAEGLLLHLGLCMCHPPQGLSSNGDSFPWATPCSRIHPAQPQQQRFGGSCGL